MTEKITISEMRELLKREEISPHKIFSKEDFLGDKKLVKAVNDALDLEEYRARETKEKEKKKEEDIYDLIPDIEPQGKPGEDDDNELIPD